MSAETVSYADIVIMALVAGFILLRLRSILGQRPDDGEPPFVGRAQRLSKPEFDAVVQRAEKVLGAKPKEPDPVDAYVAALPAGILADTFKNIQRKDAQFSATDFLKGAKMAFEMVFDAFAKGDKATLKMLLSDPIYKEFEAEIDTKAKQEQKPETTLVSVEAKEISRASLVGNMAQLTVTYHSEQVTVVRDAKGTIIEGNPSETQRVEDEWTFERDITSKNPNWKIIET